VIASAPAGNDRQLPPGGTVTEFMTVAEAAALLRIGERTAYKLVRSGRLPAVKVGNQWRIERRAFDAWVAAGGERGAESDDGVGEQE
jgi:excisionase family DNA binding protein